MDTVELQVPMVRGSMEVENCSGHYLGLSRTGHLKLFQAGW